MSNSFKEQLSASLQKAKQEGKLRSEKIREIVQTAFTLATSEVKEGSSEITSLAQDAISAVVEVTQEKGTEIKEDLTASLEGIVQGIRQRKQPAITQTQSEIKQLEATVDAEEELLRQEIDRVLDSLEKSGYQRSDNLKPTLESALDSLKDREEVDRLQNRYAELKSQLAVIQANLAQRYGERSEEVKRYLDDAKVWYERTKVRSEEVSEKVQQQHQDFEVKLEQAGTAVARKEREVKQLLKDLWKSGYELFRDRNSTKP